MDKIYVIQYDYSTEDCDGVDVYLYKDLDKALEKFKNMIQEELAFYKEYYSSDEEEFELELDDELLSPLLTWFCLSSASLAN